MSNSTVVFPPAKVNIHLQVVGKRPNGYHNLMSIFVKTSLHDTLRITLTETPHFELDYCDGFTVNWPLTDDILYKTYVTYVKYTGWQGGLKLKLEKKIPFGAGLGGGSSDAASLLLAINNHTRLLSLQPLLDLGLTLGADVPFFLSGYNVTLTTGIGEHLSPLPQRTLYMLLLKPLTVHINTKEAFGLLKNHPLALCGTQETLASQWVTGSFNFTNSFATALKLNYPYIEAYKQALYQNGALFAELSGTGSTVVGYFASGKASEEAKQTLQLAMPHCWLALVTNED